MRNKMLKLVRNQHFMLDSMPKGLFFTIKNRALCFGWHKRDEPVSLPACSMSADLRVGGLNCWRACGCLPMTVSVHQGITYIDTE